VKPPPHRLPVGLDEERRSSSVILAEPGGRSGELHEERESERRERLFIERLASLVVGNGEPDVIEHRHLLVFGGGLLPAAPSSLLGPTSDPWSTRTPHRLILEAGALRRRSRRSEPGG